MELGRAQDLQGENESGPLKYIRVKERRVKMNDSVDKTPLLSAFLAGEEKVASSTAVRAP